MVKLFAVGTLKRSFALSHALDGSQYLGEYRSLSASPAGGRPAVRANVASPAGLGRRIIGELYELDDAILARIDPLESVGRSGNLRILLRVEAISGGDTCEAFGYAKAPELATPVHSGYLNDYQDRRFIPRWQRHAE